MKRYIYYLVERNPWPILSSFAWIIYKIIFFICKERIEGSEEYKKYTEVEGSKVVEYKEKEIIKEMISNKVKECPGGNGPVEKVAGKIIQSLPKMNIISTISNFVNINNYINRRGREGGEDPDPNKNYGISKEHYIDFDGWLFKLGYVVVRYNLFELMYKNYGITKNVFDRFCENYPYFQNEEDVNDGKRIIEYWNKRHNMDLTKFKTNKDIVLSIEQVKQQIRHPIILNDIQKNKEGFVTFKANYTHSEIVYLNNYSTNKQEVVKTYLVGKQNNREVFFYCERNRFNKPITQNILWSELYCMKDNYIQFSDNKEIEQRTIEIFNELLEEIKKDPMKYLNLGMENKLLTLEEFVKKQLD
jgi:hypothetical protein